MLRVLHLGGGIRGLGARVRVGGKTPPGCTTRKKVFEKTPPLAAVAKRNPRCAERNPKVSTTTRACLSQTGAGWWLTPFGAPDCALQSGVRTEVHLDGRGAPWGASVYFPVASC